MTNALMIDLETLSTMPDAAIVAIGAAVFNSEQKVIDVGNWPILRGAWHGHIDPQTVEWWLNQSKEAQAVTFGPEGRVWPHVAAEGLVSLWERHSCATVWANDPHFDFVILESWWRREPLIQTISRPTGMPRFPFKYNSPRSYRTIRELAGKMGWTDEMNGAARGMYVAHNAVEDACAQARAVIEMEKFILNGGLRHVPRV